MSSDLKRGAAQPPSARLTAPPSTRALSSSRGPSSLVLALLTLLTLLAFLGPLVAAAAPASAAPSPGAKIADALRTSPVYVDPSYAESAVPPARQKELAAQIRKTGLPIKVALVPLAKGDAFGGNPDTLAAVVRDHLDDRGEEGILITTEEWNDDIRGFEWPGRKHQARDAVGAVGLMDEFDDAGLAELTAEAIRLIERGDGKATYDKATKEMDKQLDDDLSDHAGDDPGAAGGAGDSGRPAWSVLVVAAVVAAALLTGAALLVRSGHRRRFRSGASAHPRAPFAFPQAVFAAAHAADEAELRRRAETEVLTLGEAARAADAETTPGLRRALDAYAAAGTVLDSARGLPDLAGVLALVTEGRDALDGTPDPLPLCFFNPLHGRASRTIVWRPLGHRDQLRVSPCADCARAVRERRAPEVLTDTSETGPGGVPLPYFEVDAATSVWAATGYGSLIGGGRGSDGSDGGDDSADGLARRVARGDFSRGRRG
ncbi:hypothetical protein ABZ921_37120 [Streptomyces atriruber]|uniref:TPM domain-containing protein n=1 Tax=Streptomyces atriruber TaxID=545121 RepID=A0ABV3BZ22_9ACTN